MIYDQAKRINESLIQDNFQFNNSSSYSSNFNEPSSFDEEKDYYENLIDKWLLTTQVIKFNAKKLAESLSAHDSYPLILEILNSDQSLYKISDNKFISKRNLGNFCIQFIWQIKEEANSIYDLYKIEPELKELISSQYKKSIISLVIEELRTNNNYDIKFFQGFGFFFPSSKFNRIEKEKSQAILNAKRVLYLSKTNKSIEAQDCSLCETFLSNVKKNYIDGDLCRIINDIRPTIQFIPNSCSNVNFSPPNEMNAGIEFPLSKSTSNLKDCPIIYKDIEVYIDDFQSLHGQNWLNDKIIHMYGRIVENEYKDIFFIPPCTVQYLRYKKNKEISMVVSSWKLTNFSWVFIPFTNSESLRILGNHWSLLVWKPKEKIFYLCDSYKNNSDSGKVNANLTLNAARSIIEKLTSLCKLKACRFRKMNVPQQNNSYDCGLYLLSYIEYLVENRTFKGMENTITQEKVTEMRSLIERKILSIAKE